MDIDTKWWILILTDRYWYYLMDIDTSCLARLPDVLYCWLKSGGQGGGGGDCKKGGLWEVSCTVKKIGTLGRKHC